MFVPQSIVLYVVHFSTPAGEMKVDGCKQPI